MGGGRIPAAVRNHESASDRFLEHDPGPFDTTNIRNLQDTRDNERYLAREDETGKGRLTIHDRDTDGAGVGRDQRESRSYPVRDVTVRCPSRSNSDAQRAPHTPAGPLSERPRRFREGEARQPDHGPRAGGYG